MATGNIEVDLTVLCSKTIFNHVVVEAILDHQWGS